MATVRRVSMDQWDAHEVWTRGMSPVVENMRLQEEMARHWLKALDWDDVAEEVVPAELSAEDIETDERCTHS